jgi:phosphoribosylanthranilate isomerase
MVKVKICGLTRPADVELAIELGADALGFVCEPSSPRYVGPRVRELVDGVAPYTMCVGVYGRLNSDDAAFLNCVQFEDMGGSTSIFASAGMSHTPPVIKTVRPRSVDNVSLQLKLLENWLAEHQIQPRAFLLDAYDEKSYGGTGRTTDWDFAADFVRLSSRKVILAGGLTPDNVSVAIQKVRPYAVDVSSGIESSPGVKDPVKMRDFIQAAREALLTLP